MQTREPITAVAGDHLNVVVLRGEVTGDVTVRELPSGDTVAQFDVTTRLAVGGRSITRSSPVALHDPPAAALDSLRAGGTFVIVGSVNRRFFRVGGATQSRTEVIAERVTPERRRAQIARSISSVVDRLVV